MSDEDLVCYLSSIFNEIAEAPIGDATWHRVDDTTELAAVRVGNVSQDVGFDPLLESVVGFLKDDS